MEIKKVSHTEYSTIFDSSTHVFNSSAFNNLNKGKAGDVKYLALTSDGKTRLGIIGGLKNKTFFSPFSAPFGGWNYKEEPDLKYIEDAYVALELWCKQNNVDEIKIVFPPLFYNETALSLFFSAAARKGYKTKTIDLNFHFNLANFNGNYLNTIAYNARKNYNVGERNHLITEKVTDDTSIKLAYEIIAKNREQRGYPLKMTFENVKDTIKLVEADFFITYNTNKETIASAMVFKVTDKIAQVVYWGHNMDHSSLKPINFLSYSLFEYYKGIGLQHLDIGPSTEAGIPNYGLIEFKRSIGCDISPKLTLNKILIDERS